MGGSGASAYNPDTDINQNDLSTFVNSTSQGAQYSDQLGAIKSGGLYYNGANYATSIADQSLNSGSQDVSSFIGAYKAWQADQGNANNTWSNYANLVAQQAGGEGQQTILGGAGGNPYSALSAQQGTAAVGDQTIKPTISLGAQRRVGAP